MRNGCSSIDRGLDREDQQSNTPRSRYGTITILFPVVLRSQTSAMSFNRTCSMPMVSLFWQCHALYRCELDRTPWFVPSFRCLFFGRHTEAMRIAVIVDKEKLSLAVLSIFEF